MQNNELDILIPVFNEDEIIIDTIKNISSTVVSDYRILVCYDYEEDPTIKIVKEKFFDKKERNKKIFQIIKK